MASSENFIVRSYDRPVVPDPSALLQAGRELIINATGSSNWRSVSINFDATPFEVKDNTHTFIRKPPVISLPKAFSDLLEWGCAATPGEETWFDLQDLDEFESTDFSHLLLPPWDRIALSFQPRVERASAEWQPRPPISHDREPTPSRPPMKKRRIDTSSLYTAVPQPHFHPSPDTDDQLPGASRFPSYTRATPMPVDPYDPPTMQEYLKTPYARSAWIVPVRGTLQWPKTSSASVLEDAPREKPSPAPPSSIGGEITWTRASLASFWDFLLKLREAKNLGPISLSFHAGYSKHSAATQGEDFALSLTDSIYGSDLCLDYRPMPLSAVDHVKIYHDTGCTMTVRNVLDKWSYEDEGNGTSEDNKVRKIRLLKGACLVLVDERSKGVLTC